MPPKAAYEAFDHEPDLEFGYVLAEHLGITVADVDAMSHNEYIHWYVYLGRKHQQAELARQTGG